jgi:hypothetical protein
MAYDPNDPSQQLPFLFANIPQATPQPQYGSYTTAGPGGSFYDPNWGSAGASNPEGNWYNWQLQNARDAAAANSAAISGLNSASNGVGATTSNVRQGQAGIVQDTFNRTGAYNQQTQDLTNQLRNVNNTANQYDWSHLQPYQDALSGYNSSNTAALGGLQGLYGQLANPLQSQTSWAGDLSSQAAGAYADPSSIAAQNSAMGFLSGAMNGSLNYTSQGAQAYADPQSIQAEYAALGQLQNAANGGLNVTSQAAQVYADPALVAAQQKGVDALWNVSQGANDVSVGQMDPAAYAAQQDALAQYKGLTTPKLTDAERFIYENERLGAERDERANREAVMSGLRQRGMGGSGMELVNSQLANQQTSQNRLLGDLGANAQAVNRSMAALAGYGGLSSTMSQQANDLGTSNANRRTAALGMYTDQAGQMRSRAFDEAFSRGTAADQVAMSNMNRQLQAEGMSFDAAGNIRNQSFNEEYSRGIAADNASANNQQTQLSGGIAYGNMANTQRQQSFNEAFQRGSAADQTAQFNRQQSIGVSEWNDQFNQNERDSQWNRGLGMANTTLRTNEDNALNTTNGYNAGQIVNRDTTARTQQSIGAQDAANSRTFNNANYANGQLWDLGQGMVGDAQNSFNRQAQVTGLGIGATNQGTAAVNDIGTKFAGQSAAGTAAANAQTLADKNKDTSILWGLVSW